MMEEVLLSRGIQPEQISVIPLEPHALDAALNMAQADDLLLVFGDNCTRCWKQITKFGEQLQAQVQTPSTKQSDFISSLPLLMSHLELPEGEIIQDERGVRLARVQED